MNDEKRVPPTHTRFTFLRQEFAQAIGPELCALEGDLLLPDDNGVLQAETIVVDEADYTDAAEGVIRIRGYVDGSGGREFEATLRVIDVSLDPPRDTYAMD